MRKLMLTMTTAGLVALTTIGMTRMLRAQEGSKTPPPPAVEKTVKPLSVYRLEFTVREVEEGKRLNSRTYTMSVQDGDMGQIRVGNKVPFNSGKDQFQYFDVGVSIDCRLQDHDTYVLLQRGSIDISSVTKDESLAKYESTAAGTLNPVIRQARASVTAVVTPGKPTIVTTMDDVSSNRRYEVEVTATKVK